MSKLTNDEFQDLILRWRKGDQSAKNRLMNHLMEVGIKLIRAFRRKNYKNLTIKTFGGGNEAFIKLDKYIMDGGKVKDFQHLVKLYVQMARFYYMNYAKGNKTLKRGGDLTRLEEDISDLKESQVPSSLDHSMLEQDAVFEAIEKVKEGLRKEGKIRTIEIWELTIEQGYERKEGVDEFNKGKCKKDQISLTTFDRELKRFRVRGQFWLKKKD